MKLIGNFVFIFCLFVDGANFYIGTEKGLFKVSEYSLGFGSAKEAQAPNIYFKKRESFWEGGKACALNRRTCALQGVRTPEHPPYKVGKFWEGRFGGKPFFKKVSLQKKRNEEEIASRGGTYPLSPTKKKGQGGTYLLKWEDFEEIPFSVYDICKFKDQIIVGASCGLFKIKENKLQKIQYFDEIFVRKLLPKEDRLYIAALGGIYTSSDLKNFKKEVSLKKDEFVFSFCFINDNLWICTNKGLLLFREGRLKRVMKGIVTRDVLLKDNTLYVATDNGLYLSKDFVNFQLACEHTKGKSIQDIFADEEKIYFVCLMHGFYSGDEKSGLFQSIAGMKTTTLFFIQKINDYFYTGGDSFIYKSKDGKRWQIIWSLK